jgi:UDP-2,3-diacylglucosamine hydrolase
LQPRSENHILLSGNNAALFISDVHLCDDEPEIAAFFETKLDSWLPAHSHLFILGDLFESWCGDDAADEVAKRLITKLKHQQQLGLQIFLMRGNRDFLIDQPVLNNEQLTTSMGAQLLADECNLNAFGEPWLLCHGDQLCTRDLAYQSFRSQSRSTSWQEAFLAQPKAQRLAQAKQMRAASRAHQLQATHGGASTDASKVDKLDLDIYDVDEQAIGALMTRSGATNLLHGHTHRPAVHPIQALGHRWVLSDWAINPSRGDAISMNANGIERLR